MGADEMSRIAIGVVLTLAVAPATPAQETDRRKVEDRIRTFRVDVDFRNARIAEVVEFLAEAARVNVVIDRSARESDQRITLRARSVSVRTVLGLALSSTEFGFGVRDGVLLIASKAEFARDVRLEIIDVRDLLYPIRDFPGVEVTLADTGTAFRSVGDESESPELPLVDLVRAHVGGRTWEENPRASIAVVGGLLVVRQTPDVIAQVRRLVAQLRRYR